MDNDQYTGLSFRNRSYIVTLVFIVLLLFGPVEPYGLTVRSLYLIIIPGALWFAIRAMGVHFHLNAHDNDRITRSLTGAVAGALFANAISNATTTYHSKCTEYIVTRDGRECVGDYVTTAGPDWGLAIVSFLLAGIAFSVAIARDRD